MFGYLAQAPYSETKNMFSLFSHTTFTASRCSDPKLSDARYKLFFFSSLATSWVVRRSKPSTPVSDRENLLKPSGDFVAFQFQPTALLVQ